MRPSSVSSSSTSGSFLILLRAHHLFGGAGSGVPRWTTSRSRGVMRAATVPCDAIDEPQIARRQQSLQPAAVVDDDERADARRAHPRGGVGEARTGRNRVRDRR